MSILNFNLHWIFWISSKVGSLNLLIESCFHLFPPIDRWSLKTWGICAQGHKTEEAADFHRHTFINQQSGESHVLSWPRPPTVSSVQRPAAAETCIGGGSSSHLVDGMDLFLFLLRHRYYDIWWWGGKWSPIWNKHTHREKVGINQQVCSLIKANNYLNGGWIRRERVALIVSEHTITDSRYNKK